MTQNNVLAEVTTYTGSLACTAAPFAAAPSTESSSLMILSAIGAFTAIAGLIYSIWNGNRQFKLAQARHEMELEERKLMLGAMNAPGIANSMEASSGQ